MIFLIKPIAFNLKFEHVISSKKSISVMMINLFGVKIYFWHYYDDQFMLIWKYFIHSIKHDSTEILDLLEGFFDRQIIPIIVWFKQFRCFRIRICAASNMEKILIYFSETLKSDDKIQNWKAWTRIIFNCLRFLYAPFPKHSARVEYIIRVSANLNL